MTERIATCSCGKLSVHVRGEPVRISVCAAGGQGVTAILERA